MATTDELMKLPMLDYEAPPRNQRTPTEFRPATDEAFGHKISDNSFVAAAEPIIDVGQIPQDTTLAELYPRVDAPLRIDPPPSMKAPARGVASSRDDQIRRTAFSPAAFIHRTADCSERGDWLPGKLEAQGGTVTSIKDYTILANSAHRASRKQVEGSAYFAVAVLYDNLGKVSKALEYYKKFLEVCRATDDTVGMGLAYNCLGVDLMSLARPMDQGSSFESGRELSAEVRHYLIKAMTYHKQHLQIADEGGQFVAHVNLGLCKGELKDFHGAAEHHQDALKITMQLQSPHAQSLAVGNLGLLATRKGDLETAEACLTQHLRLTRELADRSAELEALLQLGELKKTTKCFKEAEEYYEDARRLAEQQGDASILKRLHCVLGVCRGEQLLESYFERLRVGAVENLHSD